MQKALVYCRVSTEEQVREGYSLDAQEKFCRKFAEANDYQVLEVFRDEGKSGTNLNRPALQDLLAKCQQDKSISLVIVQETDRLARNTKDHLTVRAILKKSGIKLISVAQPMLDDSPEGNMIDTILASVNQFQSDINSRKTSKGLQEKFDSGWWPGIAPVGYKNKTINSRRIIINDREKWHLVRKGLKMYQTGNYSAVEIADFFHKKGVASRSGKRICDSKINTLLKNLFYAGILRWNGQENIGKHKPMITINEHRHILSIMEAHNYHACRRRKHNFLLRGFVFCSICGQRYTAEKHPHKKVEYYHCSAVKRKHSNRGQNVEVADLERRVEDQFKNIQFSDDFITRVVQRVKAFYDERKAEKEQEKRVLLNKKMGIEKKRGIAEEKLISGVLDNDDFVRIRDRFRIEMNHIQNSLDELEAQREIDTETVRKVLLLSRNIYQGYVTSPYEIKRLYLSFFWEGLFVRNKQIVQAKPTKLIKALLQEKQVILRGDWYPSPRIIITLENWKYMASLKERLLELKRVKKELGL